MRTQGFKIGKIRAIDLQARRGDSVEVGGCVCLGGDEIPVRSLKQVTIPALNLLAKRIVQQG